MSGLNRKLQEYFKQKRIPKWAEPPMHDIGVLPGGQIIHFSTCYCKKGKK